MKFDCFKFFRAVSSSHLSPVCRAVLKEMAVVYADGAGYCWPSQARIAEGIGYSRKAVCEAVKEGAAAGWIAIQSKGGRSNAYLLTLPETPAEALKHVSPTVTTCNLGLQLNGEQLSPWVTTDVTHGDTNVTHGDTNDLITERERPIMRAPARIPTREDFDDEGQDGGAPAPSPLSLSGAAKEEQQRAAAAVLEQMRALAKSMSF